LTAMAKKSARKDKRPIPKTTKARAKKKSFAKPSAVVTRKVTEGPNKGDTIRFKANSPSAQIPGKLNPKRVVKDTGPKNVSGVTKGKKPIKSRKKTTKKK